MQKTLLILLLLISCKTHKSVSHSGSTIFIEHNDKLKLLDNIRYIGQDTLVITKYSNGQIKSLGHYAFDKEHNLTNLKIGNWTEYYQSGVKKTTGYYLISSYLDCGIGGLEKEFYNIKNGNWTYFFENEKIEATGTYSILNTKIETRCAGGDSLIFGITTKNWNFYDSSGHAISYVTDNSLEKFETIPDEHIGFQIGYKYDRQKNQVTSIYSRDR